MPHPLRLLALGVATASLVAVVACTKVPYTNRKQLNLVPKAIMHGLGASTYTSMLQGKPVRRSGRDADILSRVGRRISSAAKRPSYDWSYALIDEPTINAWCLPGGRIGFYTGILPVLQNESGMAFVMGHEVGHAVARHGAERLSQRLAIMGGLVGLELFLAEKSKLSRDQRNLLLGALGLGAEVGLSLPFSRHHEKEADVLGLMYMTSAGYPPEESIAVWERMGAMSGPKPPPFLSTHPTEVRRQANLREWMPQARKRYGRNRVGGDSLEPIWSQGSRRAESKPRREADPAPRRSSGGSRSSGGARNTGGNR